MLRACKQQPRRGQQEKPKQLRATAKFCATRGAYDTTSASTPKKRSDKRLRKLFKECTTLSDDEIKQELQEEDSTEYGSTKSDWPAENPSMLAATNHEAATSDEYSSTKWEDFTLEGYIRRLTKLMTEICQFIGTDRRNTDHKEPD
jgi:hypothetical protein